MNRSPVTFGRLYVARESFAGKSRFRGASLIELLVCIGVIALLMALALPAIDSARRTADRFSCTNRLHQLGIAISNYAADYGHFPLADSAYASVHARLLPYLGEAPVYAAVNFSVVSNNSSVWPVDVLVEPHPANTTAARSVISSFLCPGDTGPTSSRWAKVNYRVNRGTMFFSDLGKGYGECDVRDIGGAFAFRRAFSPSAFSDGLSHTAMMSEKPRGSSGRGAFLPFSGYWINHTMYPTSLDEQVATCAAQQPPNGAFQNDVGHSWLINWYRATDYNHNLGPNSAIPDCSDMASAGSINIAFGGCFTARSYHPGGVNVLFGDGRVSFVADTVNLGVWRAMSTRSGGDDASSSF